VDDRGWVIGVDIGGTFTDGIATGADGRSVYAKVPTTLPDRADGAIDCVEALAANAGLEVEELLRATHKFAHGQTATVNAMVQRDGAVTGLLTTAGFADTLRMMNISRGLGLPFHEAVDGIRGVKPESLVPYELIEEIEERIDVGGKVVVPLDHVAARAAIERLVANGVEAIAVCLLWSFLNPEHEQELRRIVAEVAPDMPVTLSSEIAPVIGEYERTFTSVANAYLAPALERYVHRLDEELRERGLSAPCLIMQSNGGLIPSREAPKLAASTLVSGLAGGVMGSAFVGELLGIDNIITSDMGGTSFEVSLIVDGHPILAHAPLAPRMAPYTWHWRMALPTIDITAIGAGGGSIAWLDRGVLKVGPHSAQAMPGPACYGYGGTEPTVTDADVVLGYLSPDNFLGGKMTIDPEQAVHAVRTRIADPLGIDVVTAAWSIVEVANGQMADLLRHLTLNKGHDPRDFHLMAFGGAGPLHVGHFGPSLGVRDMVVPGRGFAAAHSALGVAIADYRQIYVRSHHVKAPFDPVTVESTFRELEERAVRTFADWGVGEQEVQLVRSADVRYCRQFHVVEVPVAPSVQSAEDAALIQQTFETRYETLFGAGTAVPEAGVEITNLRLHAIGGVPKPVLTQFAVEGPDPSAARSGRRPVYIADAGAFQEVDVYAGDLLAAGNVLPGPAVVEYGGTTVFVHPEQQAELDSFLNLRIHVTS